LDDKIAGEVFWLDLAALFVPEPDERLFIITHDDAGVGSTDKVQRSGPSSFQTVGFMVT
jgi:hypothetical protein